MDTWLITGAFGYIGSHIARALRRDNPNRKIILWDKDIEQRPYADTILDTPNTHIIECNLSDREYLAQNLAIYKPTGVIHTAAVKSAPESVYAPLYYYNQNLSLLQLLLEEFHSYQDPRNPDATKKFIFASSAAVYENSPDILFEHSSATNPANPYGMTKLAGEHLVSAVSRSKNWRTLNLRYFNVIGSESSDIADTSTSNLLPIILRNAADDIPTSIYGHNLPTHDGTPIRDYVSVQDLADAHVKAVKLLESDTAQYDETLNLCSQTPTSVLDMVRAVEEATNSSLSVEMKQPRHGDPVRLVGSNILAKSVLDWQPTLSLQEAVESATK